MPWEESRHIREALTRWNYFPNQKAPVGEMPPSISTRQFTPEVAELLAAYDEPRSRGNLRYDDVTYFMTRHDNIPRQLALLHPRPYAKLAQKVWLHWDEIKPLVSSVNSAIRPEMHQDGRIFIMNYEDSQTKTSLALTASFGKLFRVETDVSGCFHSIYSHSIPWAVVGFEQEKARMRARGPNHWSNDLDALQMAARRGETLGVAIGPGTSSIFVELILGRVDGRLREHGFEFRRYIDDYICHCATHEQAQSFLRTLADELSTFRLHLNLQKTTIVELPEPDSEPWVAELGTALESRLARVPDGAKTLSSSDAVQYLDIATRLNKTTRDGSVLKYAVGSLLPHLDDRRLAGVTEYVVNLSWHYPVLLPYLDVLCGRDGHLLDPYETHLSAIIIKNARHRRSDGMAWPLHLLKLANLEVSPEAIQSILSSGDCVARALLYETHQADGPLIQLGRDLLVQGHHERDQQWLFLYQLYRDGAINAPEDEPSFEILREHSVSFIPNAGEKTEAELYCDFLDSPFFEPDQEIPSFEEWVTTIRREAQGEPHTR